MWSNPIKMKLRSDPLVVAGTVGDAVSVRVIIANKSRKEDITVNGDKSLVIHHGETMLLAMAGRSISITGALDTELEVQYSSGD